MLLITGIIPIENLPLIKGVVEKEAHLLNIGGNKIPCTQGTAAMLSAAVTTTSYLNIEAPQALLAGDTGKGNGSKQLYDYLINNIWDLKPDVLALHYWMPNLDQMTTLLDKIRHMDKRPMLIADAASMYAAKAAGLAPEFDFFTPDASEIAFLADPDAIHPAYINKHLFRADISQTPALVEQAYQNKGAAKNLLVKGATDYVVIDGEITDTISLPDIPELECIGGTGDTITGMLAAFIHAEIDPRPAAIMSTRSNRTAGEKAKVNPATSVETIIEILPEVFRDNLCSWSGICFTK